MADKRKILVVDDSKEILLAYTDILKHAGFEVISADSGEAALRMAKRDSPDLILLDVMMPVLDGGAVAMALSENSKTSEIPIIFMTSAITEEEALRSQAPASGRVYVSKSSGPGVIIGKIEEILK